MYSLRGKVIAALSLAALSIVPLLAETRRALLIGINTYEPPPGQTAVPIEAPPADRQLLPKRPVRTGASFRNLGGAVADARSMRRTLIDRFGFRSENILQLEDAGASRSSILAALRDQLMPANAQRGDVALFYYAGHGSQVFNSKSPEADHLDESLVPADSYKGARDIRDKELARLFNDLIDRGVILTVIVDSCHSGSIARGGPSRTRAMEIDPRDAGDPGDATRLSPQERGALILSSTQEGDEAKETADRQHGAFTWALTKVLDSVSPDLPINVVFQQVRSLMQSQASWQEPVLAGKDRSRLTMLGAKPGQEATSPIMVVKGPLRNNRVLLQGALAASLTPGCELARAGVTLRIAKVIDLAQAEAELIDPIAAQPERGSVFELSRWVVPPAEALRVFAPPATPADLVEALRNAAVQLVTAVQDNPHYLLQSRSREGTVEYALVAANANPQIPAESPLPAQTNWEPSAAAPRKLAEYAVRIQRIRGWLQLAGPPSATYFPYQLGLKNIKTGALKMQGMLVEGEQYRLALKTDSPPGAIAPRYIYVFSIDRQGKGTLLYPPPSTGTDGNRLPRLEAGESAPAVLELGQPDETLGIASPFGIDTYFLLTTALALPNPGVLDFEGVETGGSRRGRSDLESLLANVGTQAARGPAVAPAKWSVQKSQFRSVPARPAANGSKL